MNDNSARPHAYHTYPAAGEVDLKEIISLVSQKKSWLISLTVLGAGIAIIVALALPNVYMSEALLKTSSSGSAGSGASGLAAQYGGIAALAGVDLSGLSGENRVDEGIAILQSRKFLMEFIERRDIYAPLMASARWNKKTNSLEYDDDIYNPKTGAWSRDVAPPQPNKPTAQEAYKKLVEDHLAVQKDKSTGFVTVTVTHHSPYIANQWLHWLIKDINFTVKSKDLTQAQSSLEYLTSQLETTEIADLQHVFYRMIEEQMKTIMLAKGKKEYLFEVLDPPVVSEEKSGPNRIMICVLGLIAGISLGLITAIVSGLRQGEN